MSDINEIQGQPDEQNEHELKPRGVSIFFGEEDIAYWSMTGREVSEGWLKESFILYRIDMQKTTHNFYGEAKRKVYKDPIEVFGRLNIESGAVSQQTQGGIMKRNPGTLTANIYLEHLVELGLLIKRDGQHVQLDMKPGDFLMFKGQYFQIVDDGFSQLDNEYSFLGDRRFAITVKANEVDEDRFRAR
jgi:hypothetical protein